MRLRVGGQGNDGPNGGPPGDLFVILTLKPHQFFELDDNDIVCEVPVSYTQAVLGALGGHETVAFGAEYWYGRIDDLGEPNLMGHHGIAVGQGAQRSAIDRQRGRAVDG